MAAEAQHRAEEAEAARRSDATYQADILRKRKPTSLNAGGTAAISEFPKGDLVQIRNGV